MLKYILIFFLGYYIIKKLFGIQQPEKKSDNPSASKPDFFPLENQKNERKREREGEYIDYEEIK